MVDEIHAARYRRAIDEAREFLDCGLVHEAHNILRTARGLPLLKPLRRDPPPSPGVGGGALTGGVA